MNRRDFIKLSLAASVALPHPALLGRETFAEEGRAPMPKARYNDDVELSIIGLGGLVLAAMEQPEADRAVADAMERGVNYFDVAPTYGDSELKLGHALQGRREQAFVACKTTRRDAAGARQELETSLRRLRTDHVDLYQFHAVSSMEDVERILGPDGAAETFMKARDEGKVRFLGLSAHAEEPAIALMERFECQSVLFPVNFVCWSQGELGPRLVAYARQKGVTVLAIKALARQRLPRGAAAPYPRQRLPRGAAAPYPQIWYEPVEDRRVAAQALAFALAAGATACIPPAAPPLFRMALELAPALPRLSEQERNALLASAEGLTPLFSSK